MIDDENTSHSYYENVSSMSKSIRKWNSSRKNDAHLKALWNWFSREIIDDELKLNLKDACITKFRRWDEFQKLNKNGEQREIRFFFNTEDEIKTVSVNIICINCNFFLCHGLQILWFESSSTAMKIIHSISFHVLILFQRVQ
jgi:hypothetical protein